MRVFELARTLKMDPKELTSLLRKLHVKVPSHMTVLNQETIKKVKALIKSSDKAVPSSKPAHPSKPAAKKRTAAEKKLTKRPSAPTKRLGPAKKVPAKKPVAHVKEPVAHVKEPVAHVKEPVAHVKEPVAHVKEPVAHVKEPVAHVKEPVTPAKEPVVHVKEKVSVAAAPSIKQSPTVQKPLVKKPEPSAPAKEPVALKPLSIKVPVTVKELAEKLSVSPSEVIKHLMGMRILATINQLVSEGTVEKVLKLYGFIYHRPPTLEEEIQAHHEKEEDVSKLISRPPVVTFMGHVDHGKTSLLDAIRESRVIEGEAGGITQHIGAYRVSVPKGTITFLDTPGHEAFTAMRARGANVTDIVVLVIAADDGIMPQTVEAIDHARAAEATIVVALNKIDKPSADPDKVKRQLTEHDLTPEDWGGKTIVAEVSAKTSQGIDQLLELILLEAELLELKANPHKPARGAVLEGKLSKGGGPIAHVLVQSGTLRGGDVLVCGTTWGKVRAILDVRGHRHKEAGPSSPVEILGMNGVPAAGETFMVVPDERQAREVIARRQDEKMAAAGGPVRRTMSLEEFHHQLEEGRVKSLNLILKADVQGSVEALRDTLSKLSTDAARLKLLHVGVGDVTGPDILLAEASDAVVIGFHVGLTPEAEQLAKLEQVDVRRYDIIYQVVSDIRAALEGLLEPTIVEQVIGRAKVLEVFQVSKTGKVAGCQILKGKVVRGAIGRVLRGQEKLFEGKITSLKRFKDDAREVAEGFQCGLSFSEWSDFQPDDIIEVIEVQQVATKL